MDIVKDKLKVLRTRLDEVPLLQKAEEQTKVPKEYIFAGGAGIALLILVFGVGIASLSSLVGFAYPAYKSFQAIESKAKGDDTQWLVYWVIFAIFSIMEIFADVILYWIPFYYAFKLAFLLWAMLPQTKGAKFLYDSFLRDFLKKNESRIDAAMANAKKNAAAVASDVTAAASDAAAAVAAGTETKKDS